MIKDVPPKETFAENTPEAIIGTIATINKKDTHDCQAHRPDKNNIIQDLGQIICCWFSRTNTRYETALFFNIICNFYRIKRNRSIKIRKEND